MASGSKKVIIAALIGNSGIAVTKFIAAAFTGSSAMLAEGIHSVVDTGNQVLLLLGLKRAALPPDENFPLGYGKEVYFWSFMVAVLIFGVGAGVSFYEGLKHLLHPHPIEKPFINYIVLSIAMVFEAGAWWFAWKAFNLARGNRGYFEAVRHGKDPTLFVVLFEDTAAMLGLIIAFVGVLLGQMTGSPYFDGTASMLIGIVLAVVAVWLAWEAKGLLIGEAADRPTQLRIREIVVEQPGINRINELVTMHMGPENILVNISVDFADDLTAEAIERAVAACDRRIKEAVPAVRRVFIEAEAWAARSKPAGASTITD